MAKTATARRSAPTELLLQRLADGRLVALSLLSAYKLDTTAATDARTSWIQVALTGDFVSRAYGEFSITKSDLKQMLSNFKDGVHPVPPTELCMDYDHLSEEPASPGDGKAAGWYKDLELRNHGNELWALIEWTPDGATAIETKEYQFVSPTFAPKFTTPKGEEVGCTLLAGAITNRPFLQGMEPLSLSGVFGGVADRKTAESGSTTLADFSFDERRARISEALNEWLGRPEYVGEHYWYLCDVYDTFVTYRQNGHHYQLEYAIDEKGVVTFSGEPIEIIYQPVPLSASGAQGDTDMKTLKLTDAQGKAVEIPEDTMTAAIEGSDLVKQLRAKIPADGTVVAMADHEKVVADVVTLRSDLKTLKEQAADRDAESDVEKLLTAGKITPAQKDHYKALRLKDAELFKKLSETLTVVSPVKKPVGSGEQRTEGETGESATAEVERLATELRTKETALTQDQAVTKVLSANRELYNKYSAENTIKV